MTRTGRILVVTLGLIAAGAVFGALAGALALAIGLAITDGPAKMAAQGWVLQIPGYLGAALGAVSLPLVAWLLLRRVALGRAIVGCVIGTVLGGAIAWAVPIGTIDEVERGILGAFAGFVLAGVLMWERSRAAA